MPDYIFYSHSGKANDNLSHLALKEIVGHTNVVMNMVTGAMTIYKCSTLINMII